MAFQGLARYSGLVELQLLALASAGTNSITAEPIAIKAEAQAKAVRQGTPADHHRTENNKAGKAGEKGFIPRMETKGLLNLANGWRAFRLPPVAYSAVPGGDRSMKLRVLSFVAVCLLACAMMASSAMADHRFGAYDSGHVWRDADYWHARYPSWLYSHHPEWVVEQRDWWWYDHREHPDWFWGPFWEEHPLWAWGAPYRGVWRDHWWWHQYHPDWLYAHHPEWAAPYGGWLREDHDRHPDWFNSSYWRGHPRDWANPDKEFWNREDDRFKRYVQDHPEHRYVAGSHEPGQTVPHQGARPNPPSRGPTQNVLHSAPQPASHPAVGVITGGSLKKN